ncbi:hypothetical protein ABZ532_23655 [Streptomyces sp. NPDC019396]|uniref:hypothetical protein n=1 Tax=Streptomyces sp. NPDC019396 TaxID=3154687 RepID=UPI00340A9515
MTASSASTASTSTSTPAGGERCAPRADCVADSAGAVTFTWAGGAADGEALVLRRRGAGTGPDDTVRLPLVARADDQLHAVLPGTVELAEGHWDAYLDDGTAVEAGIRDLRALIDRVPQTGRVTVRLPHPTADGRLAVRSWVREPHAEAGDIAVEQGAFAVECVLYGARIDEGASVEARLGDRAHRFPATGEGERFSFTVPYSALVEGPAAPVGKQQLWTLWLCPAAEAEDAVAVRISRLLDDVWDRKDVFVYPAHEAAGYRAAPCYTAANDLCVQLTPA